jgi:UDP-glucuronate 4-epimerase
MRILVTGAAGFIGSALSASLAIGKHEVLGIDNYSDYYSIDLKQKRAKNFLEANNIELLKLDLINKEQVNKIVSEFKPDSVIHLAAQAGVRLPQEEYSKYVDSNLIGFTNVATATAQYRVSNFLFASSSSVYGDSAKVPYSESEESLHPQSFYGVTKRFNEMSIAPIFKHSQTRTRGLRFFTVYGPWGRPDMAYFRMISNIVASTPFELFGNGEIARDFTYIDDVVSVVSNLMSELSSREAGFSDVVNVGGGRPLSMNYLSEVISSFAGKKVVYDKLPSKPEDVAKTMADSTYLMSLIGLKPETKLEDGISNVIEWAKNVVDPITLDTWAKSAI